jgi:hypothetical protein
VVFPSLSRKQLVVECEQRERPNRELGGVVFFKFLTTDYHFLPCLTNNNATRKPNWRWHLRGVLRRPNGRGTPMWPRTQLTGGPGSPTCASLSSLAGGR